MKNTVIRSWITGNVTMRAMMCVVLVIMIIGTAGCGKSEEIQGYVAEENLVETESDGKDPFPSEVHISISDELEVHASVHIPEDFSGFLKQYPISHRNFDEQIIFETLGIQASEMKNPAQGTFFNEELNLSIGETLAFATRAGVDYRMLAVPEFCPQQKELSFSSIEDAMEQASDLVESALQVSPLMLSEIYVFDSESEKLCEKTRSEEGYQIDIKTGEAVRETILDGKEGGYYFEFVQTVDGIPVYQFDREKDGTMLLGVRVCCIYTQEGIEYLEASKPYVTGEAQRDIPILNVEAVLDLLCRKLDTIIITDKLEVTEMELLYLPADEAVLKPVWKIVMQDAGGEVLVYFDAETGTELLL